MSDDFITISNDSLTLVLWPGCGGRLISLQVEGTELLWRNPDYVDPDGRLVRPRSDWPPLDGSMGSWSNVGGSKTWPAPQGWSGPGEWPGPPDPVLDSGAWSVLRRDLDGAQEVVLRSPDDRRSGLRVTRSFLLPRTGRHFTQVNTFRNIASEPVRWSIWEVCQVDTAAGGAGGELRVGVTEAAEPTVMIEAFGTVPTGTLRGGERILPLPDVVGKLGFPDASGTLEFARPDGASVRLEFAPEPDGEYPDGGSRVELWLQCPIEEPLAEFGGLHPQAHLVELEVLGPLRTLAPGESASLELSWAVTPPRRCDDPE